MDTPILGDATLKFKRIPINFADATAEITTGFTLPATSIVRSVSIRVITAEATGGTKTLNVGTLDASNNPAGFLAGISVAAVGVFTGVLTEGSVTRGVLLTDAQDTAANLVPVDFAPNAATVVSWTPGDTDWAEFDGEIIIEYLDLAALS
jgi:hypothetical protein